MEGRQSAASRLQLNTTLLELLAQMGAAPPQSDRGEMLNSALQGFLTLAIVGGNYYWLVHKRHFSGRSDTRTKAIVKQAGRTWHFYPFANAPFCDPIT